MKFELEEFHHNAPDEEMLGGMRRVANKLDKNSLTTREQNEHGKFHSTTMMIRFGSWFNALEKAGLQKTRTPANISEEDLFKNLEEIWIKIGRQPKFRETRSPLSKYSSDTYTRRFGSWRKALGKFVAYINNEENASSEEAMCNIGKSDLECRIAVI